MNQHTPFRVALTGGIACGKTAATDLFAELGVPVVDADVVSRELTAAGQPGLQQLVGNFGEGILRADGTLDRPAFRQLLFADNKLREQVNALLHPLILDEMQLQVARHNNANYIILAIPLLVETDAVNLADRVLVVDCTEEQQLQRLNQRDTESIESARRMLASQASRTTRLNCADDVLDNTGEFDFLRQQTIKLHKKYLSLAKQANIKHNRGL